MTVADPLSPDWLPPVAAAADVPDPSPRHLSAVPEPVPPAVFDAIARLVPAPRPAAPPVVTAPVVAAPVVAAPVVAAPVVAAPVVAVAVAAPRVSIPTPTPAADADLDGYTLRQMVLAELRSLARGV